MARRFTSLVVLAVLCAACSTPSPAASPISQPTAAAETTGAGPSTTPGLSGLPPASSTAQPQPISSEPPALAIESVTDGLADPISVTGTPEGWLLVNERPGRVVAVNPVTGATAISLDLTDRVLGQGEQGLLGFALHPEWPGVPRAFVHYSDRATDGDTVLSELTGSPGSSDAPPTFDASSEQVLLREDQPYANHNGGQLAFGPDGYLYLGLGDGGSGGDPHGHGQDANTLLGSILRLDVSSPGELKIPSDNPFADGEGGRPEVFLYGLRNPWRFSFDRETRLLWIADVGQNAYEEVNRIDPVSDAGANLGWNLMEATHCFEAAECSTDGLTLPLVEYGRDLGCSTTGGYVYRGDGIPDLRGWYLFGDYCGGSIFGIASDAEPPAEGGALPPRTLLQTGIVLSSFGEATDGELYLTDLAGGTLYRIVAAP